jgi:hypothetical protein
MRHLSAAHRKPARTECREHVRMARDVPVARASSKSKQHGWKTDRYRQSRDRTCSRVVDGSHLLPGFLVACGPAGP